MRMTDRERFLATMYYRPRDRAPICDFGFWPETIEQWHAQGLPAWVTGGHDTTLTDRFFGMDRYHGGGGIGAVGLCPAFVREVLEDRGDHELVRQEDGVIVLRKKFMSSIPEHHGHLLVDRESWQKHYRPRLNPEDPARLPARWPAPDREWPAIAWCGSLFGWLRDWMGIENLALVVYDDAAWFEEMVTTLADCVVAQVQAARAAGAQVDAACFWEDMCYNAGPLLSPQHFQQYLVPHYRRITEGLRALGCEIVWVDCDGKIDDLVPLWLEAGVNGMFPVEIGTWGADPIKFRRQYGRELRLMGGFDKHILARTPADIEREIYRLTPLVEEGGYIPFCDHRVPPDVSYQNYLFYLRLARKVWGRDTNLKPMLCSP